MGNKFEEIDVERINIVDSDGTLRLTIANGSRQPDVVIDGESLRSRNKETSAGFIFFNEEGDECGGFQWSGKSGKASSRISFDQYKHDEVLTVEYGEDKGQRIARIFMQDRPDVSLKDIVIKELHPVWDWPDSEEKTKEIARIRSQYLGNERVSLGRTPDGEAALVLSDSKGNPRIRLCVDSDDEPKLEMLDKDGNVVFSLPPKD